MPIGILGTGSYLPENEVTNAELAPGAGVDEDWIVRKTNIRGRRFAAPDEATSDLGAAAARAALEQAGVAPGELDLVIVSTSTPDAPLPQTSCVIQYLIGADRAAAFDVNAACSGFIFALKLAHDHVAVHPDAKVLVIAAELYSRFIDLTDRKTAVLLGDGAGAAVVGRVADGYGFLRFDLASNGDLRQLIRLEAGGSRLPASAETVAGTGHYLKMEGRQVREYVIEHVPGWLARSARRADVPLDEIRHVVPHQPNGRLLDELAELSANVGLVNATVHHTVERFGNIGSASAAFTLDHIVREGTLRDGELAILTSFGAGMALGNCVLRWQEPATMSRTGDLAA